MGAKKYFSMPTIAKLFTDQSEVSALPAGWELCGTNNIENFYCDVFYIFFPYDWPQWKNPLKVWSFLKIIIE